MLQILLTTIWAASVRGRPPAPHEAGEGRLQIRSGRGVADLPHGGVEAHPRGGGGAANAHLAEAQTVAAAAEDEGGVGGRDGDGRRRRRGRTRRTAGGATAGGGNGSLARD